MDIAGAKALKERLGHHVEDDAPATSVDVSEDAPPVFRYLGVSEARLESPPAEPRSSWLRRLMRPRRGQG
jgi:hypothetical protein